MRILYVSIRSPLSLLDESIWGGAWGAGCSLALGRDLGRCGVPPPKYFSFLGLKMQVDLHFKDLD